MEKQRGIVWDVLKGIGIFLVIMLHTGGPEAVRIYIGSFIMPLFFWVSGALLEGKTARPLGVSLKKAVKGNLLPYAVFWAISLAEFEMMELAAGRGFFPVEGKHLLGLLLGGGYLDATNVNFPLWYLHTNCVVALAFMCLRKLPGKYTLYVLAAVFTAVTIPIQTALPGRPAFHANAIPCAMAFMCFGAIFARHGQKLSGHTGLGVVLVIVGLLLSDGGHVADVGSPLFFVSALCIIVGLYLVSEALAKLRLAARVLGYIGERTLYVLGLHLLIANVVSYPALMTQLGFSISVPTNVVYCLCNLVGCLVLAEAFLAVKGKLVK